MWKHPLMEQLLYWREVYSTPIWWCIFHCKGMYDWRVQMYDSLLDYFNCVQSQCNEFANITLHLCSLPSHVTFIHHWIAHITERIYQITDMLMFSTICQFLHMSTELRETFKFVHCELHETINTMRCRLLVYTQAFRILLSWLGLC